MPKDLTRETDIETDGPTEKRNSQLWQKSQRSWAEKKFDWHW
jgi:hypothetical protein